MKRIALLFLALCAPCALAAVPEWSVEVKTDPITDAKTATVSTFESGDVDAIERAEIAVYVSRSGYGVFAVTPGILFLDRTDAQMRFDDAPAETVPFAPAGRGTLMCLRRDGIVPKLLASKRVVLRVANGGRQKTAIFDFSGFAAAWKDALAKVGGDVVQAAAASALKRAGWEVEGATATREAVDLAWSSGGGVQPVVLGVTARAGGSAGLALGCGAPLDTDLRDRTTIRFRLDGGEWSEGSFAVSGKLAVYPGDATAVVKKMAAARKLEVEFRPLLGKSFVSEFDLAGMAAALKRLKPMEEK
ncbi:MAG: hypothetical protein IJL06_04800 [Kiritimatiellae bacterium]|nr:hypothetical protein [Kiritimatiellia bacterium]